MLEMKSMKRQLFAVGTAGAMALALGASAQAGTIYQDSFGGNGSAGLNGTAPTVGANTWVASNAFQNDGSIGGTNGSATLAFTPENGYVYTLDVSLTGVTGGPSWIGAGFAHGQSTLSDATARFVGSGGTNNVSGLDWAMLRGTTDGSHSNNTFQGTVSAPNSNGVDYASGKSGGAIDYRFILDTTGGAGNWTIKMLADLHTGTSGASSGYQVIRNTEAVLDPTDINSVGIADAGNMTGNVTSFQLTSVPEPASLALLGMGGLLLIKRRHRA